MAAAPTRQASAPRRVAPQAFFDERFPPPQEAGGYDAVVPTAAGRATGLCHTGVASSPIDARAGVTVPAADESDLSELRAVIEQGVTW